MSLPRIAMALRGSLLPPAFPNAILTYKYERGHAEGQSLMPRNGHNDMSWCDGCLPAENRQHHGGSTQ